MRFLALIGLLLLAPALASAQRAALLEAQRLKRAPILRNVGYEVPGTVTEGKRRLEHPDGKSLFKPPAARPLHGIPVGTDPVRERAFFVTAAYLGIEAPATVMRRLDGVLGSQQAWAAGQPAVDALLERSLHGDLYVPSAKLARLDWESVHALAVLDYVTNNRDRHWGNFLMRERGGRLSVLPIDSGLSFAPSRDPDPLAIASYELAILGAERGGPRRLSDGLLARIRGVDENRLARHLRRSGLEDWAVREAIERLGNVKRDGLSALVRRPVSGFPGYLVTCGLRGLAGGAAAEGGAPLPATGRFCSMFVSTPGWPRW